LYGEGHGTNIKQTWGYQSMEGTVCVTTVLLLSEINLIVPLLQQIGKTAFALHSAQKYKMLQVAQSV